jgi:hypothetical protein
LIKDHSIGKSLELILKIFGMLNFILFIITFNQSFVSKHECALGRKLSN